MDLRRVLICTLMALSIAVAASAAMVCSQCGKTISGRYYTAGDRVYCSEACILASRPACVVCGKKTLQGGFYRNGKYVCSEACLRALSPKCHLCGQPIMVGRIITVDGRQYCDICYKTPKCAQCGLPAGNSRLPDGRPYCLECIRRGINSVAQAERIFFEVKRCMRERLGIVTAPDIRFHLVDLPTLSKLAGTRQSHERGLYRYTAQALQTVAVMGDDTRKVLATDIRQHRDIYVLSYLDVENIRAVIAHELMHDWTASHFPDIPDRQVVEGLSEYAAWNVCRLYGHRRMMRRLEQNEVAMYRRGFEQVRQADRGHGLADITYWLKR